MHTSVPVLKTRSCHSQTRVSEKLTRSRALRSPYPLQLLRRVDMSNENRSKFKPAKLCQLIKLFTTTLIHLRAALVACVHQITKLLKEDNNLNLTFCVLFC